MRVELDKKSIFALASDTRLEILKALQPMRRTVTQLSDALGVDKGAIHRHLKKMREGGLVKRYEEHGFVYYGLTWKARDLLVPNENTRIVVVLSMIWILALAVAFFLSAGLMAGSGDDDLLNLMPGYSEGADEAARDEAVSDSMYWLVPAIVLGGVIIALANMALKLLRKPLQEAPERHFGIESGGGPGSDD